MSIMCSPYVARIEINDSYEARTRAIPMGPALLAITRFTVGFILSGMLFVQFSPVSHLSGRNLLLQALCVEVWDQE